MAGFFSGRAKPRQFNYRPIYYNPEQERREKRREELLGKRVEEGDYQPGDIIRGGGMRAKGKFITDTDYAHKQRRQTATRLVVILVLLMAVVAIIFFWKI
mgnify:CR=1 FL=1